MKKVNYLQDELSGELYHLEPKPVIFGRAIPCGEWDEDNQRFTGTPEVGSRYYSKHWVTLRFKNEESAIKAIEMFRNITMDNIHPVVHPNGGAVLHIPYAGERVISIIADFDIVRFLSEKEYFDSCCTRVPNFSSKTTSPFYEIRCGHVKCIREVHFIAHQHSVILGKGVRTFVRYPKRTQNQIKKLFGHTSGIAIWKYHHTGNRCKKYMAAYGVRKSKGKRLGFNSKYINISDKAMLTIKRNSKLRTIIVKA